MISNWSTRKPPLLEDINNGLSEDDDKKSDFIKEMEEITSGCLNWFEKLGRFSTELINTEIRNYNGELLLSGITMFGTDINKLMKQIN